MEEKDRKPMTQNIKTLLSKIELKITDIEKETNFFEQDCKNYEILNRNCCKLTTS